MHLKLLNFSSIAVQFYCIKKALPGINPKGLSLKLNYFSHIYHDLSVLQAYYKAPSA